MLFDHPTLESVGGILSVQAHGRTEAVPVSEPSKEKRPGKEENRVMSILALRFQLAGSLGS